MQLTPDAAAAFEAFTEAHVGETLLLALDDEVLLAPRITGAIPNGQIWIDMGWELSEREAIEQAQDLVVRLRASALPTLVKQID